MGVDSEKHPMMAMMKAAQGKTRMHMPGHKGRGMKWLSVAMDMTELKDTDDLFAASSGIDKALFKAFVRIIHKLVVVKFFFK